MALAPVLALALAASSAPLPVQERATADAAIPCQFVSAAGELVTIARCARTAHPTPQIVEAQRKRLHFDRHGLAAVAIGDQWFYYDRKGAAAPVMVMDNGAEAFADGRARSRADGKIGFIDRSLRLVIPRRYDGALPFADGLAAVCIGCTLQRDGEYHHFAGGRWLCVDRTGRETPAASGETACARDSRRR
ncbi:WG repeat-containing protein [Sphingomonas pokkalii]|uniref:WG repeat-containing protein n=1 Tax=Sphingomonas pokkalii TaxID=2175090 RepID=A0A2U0SHW3_9SPHN|nr:WG repeat-containing protein [Sphingomonas pokkalii]PVX30923.1 hypothetical protein DD559_17630 [Sphingomonas pokkalii]